MSTIIDATISEAASVIRQADGILIGAGAGMGVDSGLPDFRGPEGFWRAYPAFRGRRFEEMSNPRWFDADPRLAWGFFGHRLNLYRNATPHEGFSILRHWGGSKPLGSFVVTSNVDGQFLKAGFPENRILEVHGSIHHLQCTVPCQQWEIWPEPGLEIEVDPETVRTDSFLPTCPHCGCLARPNILMFMDSHWVPRRTARQMDQYNRWRQSVGKRTVAVIELGAGTAIPTIRRKCEAMSDRVIRINPRDCRGPDGTILIPLGAREALQKIDEALGRL